MEETRILLLFRDGVVDFDDVSEIQFFTLKKERVCRVRFRNGNVSVYSLYKDGVVPLVLLPRLLAFPKSQYFPIPQAILRRNIF